MDRQPTFEEIPSQNVVEQQVRELKNLKGKLGTLFGRAVERKFNYPVPHRWQSDQHPNQAPYEKKCRRLQYTTGGIVYG